LVSSSITPGGGTEAIGSAILKTEIQMKTYCVRDGQVEVGVVEHDGHRFSALGASVVGRHVTGYTRLVRGDITLATWCGKTMFACRSEVVERFWSGTLVLLFRLPRGRFIVGYALGDNGMLFRGELLIDVTDEEARQTARQISERFAELDDEDKREWLDDQD
jgi:hypothetical protein